METESGQSATASSNAPGVNISGEEAQHEASTLLSQISPFANPGGSDSNASVQTPPSASTAPNVSSLLGEANKSVLVGNPPSEPKPDATGHIAASISFSDFDAV